MKKIKSIFLTMAISAAFATSLTGCGKSANTDSNNSSTTVEQTTLDATTAVASATDNTDKDESQVNALSGVCREDLTAKEFAVLMGNGINLGNTMEAYTHNAGGNIAAVSASEGAWGQPITTKEMIDGMKEAGFDTIRIPVAWTNGMHFEEGDYTISEDYLNRVDEIVNYALSNNMYVIINDHWDGGWWGMFGNKAMEADAFSMYSSMWTQIGEKFAKYGDYVVFESANEELGPRLVDKDIYSAVYKAYKDDLSKTIFSKAFDDYTDEELSSGAYLDTITELTIEEQYELSNRINQTFVDTIRGLGGNNANRFLLLAGINTDIKKTCNDLFVMPTDTAKEKLMVSVHYYTPTAYCLNGVSHWGTEAEYKEMEDLISMLEKFSNQGYGVIIGEYAVLMEGASEPVDNTDIFIENLLNLCDMYGYVPVLWDCDCLYSKKNCDMIDATIAGIFTEHSYEAQKDKSAEELTNIAKEKIEAAKLVAIENDKNSVGANDLNRDGAIAWLMYDSADWSVVYSVGDVYAPESATDGLVANDVQITGEGTYKVSLDFTGCNGGVANGTAFMALGIFNGEKLFPNYEIIIDNICVNGEPIEIIADPVTTSDDDNTTRVNIYNEWTVPKEIIVNTDEMTGMQTFEVNFTYKAK